MRPLKQRPQQSKRFGKRRKSDEKWYHRTKCVLELTNSASCGYARGEKVRSNMVQIILDGWYTKPPHQLPHPLYQTIVDSTGRQTSAHKAHLESVTTTQLLEIILTRPSLPIWISRSIILIFLLPINEPYIGLRANEMRNAHTPTLQCNDLLTQEQTTVTQVMLLRSRVTNTPTLWHIATKRWESKYLKYSQEYHVKGRCPVQIGKENLDWRHNGPNVNNYTVYEAGCPSRSESR